MSQINAILQRRRSAPKRYSCYEQLESSDDETEGASSKSGKKRMKKEFNSYHLATALSELVKDSVSIVEQNSTSSYLVENDNNEENMKYGVNAFVCKECGKVLRSKDTLLRHEISHSGLKPFLCTICDRGFSSAVALKEHKAKHENKKLYECSLCSKTFRQNSCYHRHLLTHSKTYSHICNVCNRCFSSKDYLRSHMKCHSNVRNYKCKNCPKAFSRASDLNRHQILHTGKRPYNCEICNVSFADRSSYRRHVKDHDSATKLQSYACSHCTSSFKKSSLLTQHLLKKHKIAKSNNTSMTNTSTLTVEGNYNAITPPINIIQDSNFENDTLLLVEDSLHCPELSESNICGNLPLNKESLNEMDECGSYLEANNYNNFLTLPSSVLKDISAEVGVENYNSPQKEYYPDKCQANPVVIEQNCVALDTNFFAYPDFTNQDYYKWLNDFTLLVKVLSFPLNADVFNKIGQVHKTVSDVLADPSCFLFCKDTFAKLRGICYDLDQVKSGHLDFIFDHLQE